MLFSTNNQDDSIQAHIQLITRVRSLQPNDHVLHTPYFQVDPSHGTILLGNNRVFQLENVLPFDFPQHAVFKGFVEPIVNASFDGYNITVIAYGQTGSGKTYTIFGPGLLYTMNEADFGLVPRTVRHLFYRAKEYPNRQISIQASYLEIYDEEIHDLLSVEPFHGEITVQEDQNGEIVIIGDTRMECQTIDDVFSCLETGLALRHTGPVLNQLSSRSHGIFTLYLQQAWTQDGCLYEVCSKLHFVDLAGSERLGLGIANHEEQPTQTAFQEPFIINSGLLALSNVTAALGDPRRKASHVTYWDSKLTYILKDSLGGNAFTVMVVCLSPSASDLEESSNTLSFASRAANICNRPVANIRITPISNNPFNNMGINPRPLLSIDNPNQKDPSSGSVKLQLSGTSFSCQNATTTCSDTEESQTECQDHATFDQDEIFRLRFAASQWQLLVTNAESLLSELAATGLLENETKNKIESWLCFKEECANCIDPDLCAIKVKSRVHNDSNGKNHFNLPVAPNVHQLITEPKTLHVIEEVSEPTPTREPSIEPNNTQDMFSSDSSSEGSHFAEQLDVLRQKFRESTDLLIYDIESVYDNFTSLEWKTYVTDVVTPSKFQHEQMDKYKTESANMKSTRKGRRSSIFGIADVSEQRLPYEYPETELVPITSSPSRLSNSKEFVKDNYGSKSDVDSKDFEEFSPRPTGICVKQQFLPCKIPKDTFKSAESIPQPTVLKMGHMDEFNPAMRVHGLLSYSEEETSKRETNNINKDITLNGGSSVCPADACAQHNAFCPSSENGDNIKLKEKEKLCKEKFCVPRKSLDCNFFETEDQSKDNLVLQNLTSIAPQKLSNLKQSLSQMKDQQSALVQQLRLESEKKEELMQEIKKDHERINELERQLQQQKMSTENGILERCRGLDIWKDGFFGDCELEHKWRWLVAEEERLVELRTAVTCRSEELEERLSTVEKREMALETLLSQTDIDKGYVNCDTGLRIRKDTDSCDKIMQTSSSFSQKGRIQELQTVPINDNVTDKEIIRKEIRKMRHTRDALVQQRQELDELQHRGRELGASEERRLLELDEAIEAVDAAIEYKNEIICSRQHDLKIVTEDGLLCRLMSLSHAETRSLLCKYFQKVIDLREGSKKMEQQFAELEAQYEDQSRYIRKLSAALKHTQLEMERRSSTHQRNYEHKPNVLPRHFNSGTGDKCNDGRKLHQFEDNDYENNRDLRKQLRELLSVTPKNKAGASDNSASGVLPVASELAPSACSSRTPSLLGLQAVQALHQKITGLHRMRGRQIRPETTTTVTREKNKLIIKQETVQPEVRETKRRQR